MNVLVVNVGSSTVKLHLVDQSDKVLASHEFEGEATDERIHEFVDHAGDHHAIGHRIVHGGARFTTAALIDTAMLRELDELSDLAPLHNPPAVRMLRATLAWNDRCPNIACFDTTFHATLTEAARTYAIPEHWRTDLGVRRFGFHGLSHAYASRRAADVLGLDLASTRVVSCHLGAGASLAAVENGQSVDTTMGFTPLEGLVMATRSGDFDPGAMTWLVDKGVVGATDLDDVLNHRSGLTALAGTGDMRRLLERRDAGDAAATLAVAVYVHRLSKSMAAMAASMAGADALVFTGGVGEHAPAIRALACEPLAFLGVAIDTDKNESVDSVDTEITASHGSLPVAVVHAREDLEIARQVRQVLKD